MIAVRRKMLQLAVAAVATAGAGLSRMGQALAAAWNKTAFESRTTADALRNLGALNAVESRDVVISGPDIAEDGGAVPITVTSRIPGTQSISIVAEKNPFPLTSTHDIANGAEAYVSIRLKIAESSNVRAIVRAGGRFYTASKEVKITIGGCAA